MATALGLAPRNAMRKVRVRVPVAAGSLNKGDRYTVTTVRTIVLAADLDPAWHGDAATMPPQWALDAAADEAMRAGYTKRNKLCPACGLLRSTAGKCDCNS